MMKKRGRKSFSKDSRPPKKAKTSPASQDTNENSTDAMDVSPPMDPVEIQTLDQGDGRVSTVIFLKAEQSFYCYGSGMLEVLHGLITINGYHYAPGMSPLSFEAPFFAPALTLSTSIPRITTKKLEVDIDRLPYKELVDQFLSNRPDCVAMAIISPPNSLPPISHLFHPPPYAAEGLYTSVTPTLYTATSTHGLAIPSDWSSFSDGVIQALVEAPHIVDVPIVVVCGSKGNGKSSFCRYFANRLMDSQLFSSRSAGETPSSHNSEVVYLDCDIGQSEFTPPGFVSLNAIHEPLVLEPFRHVNLPNVATTVTGHYLGGTSPKEMVKSFELAVQNCLSVYRSDYSHVPLIINTSGWVTGRGLEMLLHIIEEAKPTNVVSLGSDALYRVNQQNATENEGNPENDREEDHVQSDEPDRRYYKSETLSSATTSLKSTVNPAFKRSLQIMSYFQRPFLPQHTYIVPWSSVQLANIPLNVIDKNDASSEELLHLLNASIVGLGRDASFTPTSNDSEDGHEDSSEIDFVICSGRGSDFICTDIALIKSVDPLNRTITLATPATSLADINTLVIGKMAAPSEMLQHENKLRENTDNTPYMTNQLISGFSTSASVRGYVGRHNKK